MAKIRPGLFLGTAMNPSLKNRRHAFTLIELLTVIAIIGILAAIIIPTVGKVRESARSSQCASNLRQIGMAFQLHAQDKKGALPATQGGSIWTIQIHPYLAGRNIRPDGGVPTPEEWLGGTNDALVCPTHRVTGTYESQPWNTGYAMNYRLYSPDMAANASNSTGTIWNIDKASAGGVPASRKILVTDHNAFQFQVTSSSAHLQNHINNAGSRRHGNRANYLFLDGHVEALASSANSLYSFYYQVSAP